MTSRALLRRAQFATWAAAAFLVASPAFASPTDHGAPAPSPKTGLLRVVLGLALAFALAVIGALPIVRRLERRFGLTVIVSSGLPFLILGVIFRHPSVGVLTDDVVTDLRPALEFGFGWLGFAVGMQFDVRELDTLPAKTATVVVAESAIPLLTVAVACVFTIMGLDPTWSFAGLSLEQGASREWLRDGLALGACAAQAAPVAAVAIAGGARGVAARIVEKVTRLDDVAGIIVLGLIGAFWRPTDAIAAWKLPHIAWLFVQLGMGGVLGILTYLLVRAAKSAAEESAYLLGAIAISAGMSGYLALSPITTCAIAGALLINLPLEHVARLRTAIVTVERPLYLIFLLIAGAIWDPTAWQGWVLAPIFVFARVGGKLIGGYVAKRAGPEELPDPVTLGLALAPQSPIAIATIVSYVTLYKPDARGASNLPWMMTAVIVGGVLTELTVQAIVRFRGGLQLDRNAPPDDMHSQAPPPVARTDEGKEGVAASIPSAPRVPTFAAPGDGADRS